MEWFERWTSCEADLWNWVVLHQALEALDTQTDA